MTNSGTAEAEMSTNLNATPAPQRGSERAAQAIVALINSRPYSPRQDEIAAIIEELAIDRAVLTPAQCSSLDEYGPDLSQGRP
jgi:hypothetical protein